MVMQVLDAIDGFLYYPVLLIVMAAAGLYFTIRMGFVQVRMLPEGLRVMKAKPTEGNGTSPFQALMISTASCVGTGNIIGVSTAICLGGAGAAFWMTVMALIGCASSFSYGGPAYYIEDALKSKGFATIFVVFLLLTYSCGFNLLCSYNTQSTFQTYGFYVANPKLAAGIIGAVLALLVGICVMGGGKRIEKTAGLVVPFMGVAYVVVTLVVLVMHAGRIPAVFGRIFTDAFNFRAIFGGIAGSCLVLGIKRGLYSNEAGVGSAPNAAAAAVVSHPAKQGLVQMLSVYIDTIILCNATALMCLVSGVEPTAELAGAQWVQTSLRAVLGDFGPLFITVAMLLFSFTTLIGNLYYCDNALAYLNHKTMPSQGFLKGFRIYGVIVIFVGALLPMAAAWDIADIMMGGMCFLNLIACVLLSRVAIGTYHDYVAQRKAGKEPVFHAKDIGLNPDELDYWKD